ncbi:MAG: cytidylate kinase-like family protein [Desulfobacterales bacterium]
MGVITISRGSYSKGKQIAEKLSQKLGYECISRDILLETSAHFNIPELKLVRAIHDAPSIFERFKDGKERYITFIREAFLEHIRNDNIVYHGLAGHFYILKKDDEERREWSRYLYGLDTNDPSLYDIVLHIDNLNVVDAVGILTNMARLPCFQTTPESQKITDDYYLTAKAQETLLDRFPSAEVKCKNGVVYVTIETALSLEKEFTDKIINTLKSNGIDGIKQVRVNVIPFESGD